jgi:hypothetical protein
MGNTFERRFEVKTFGSVTDESETARSEGSTEGRKAGGEERG